MSSGTAPAPVGPLLLELQIADDPAPWAAAGFAVDGSGVALGPVRLLLTGRPDHDDAPTGIVGWTLAGVSLEGDYLDGLPTQVANAPSPSDGDAVDHANGAIGIDHVVVTTPDLDRTLDALATAGLELRRIRETTSAGSPMRQAFFRLGPTVLEVVGGPTGNTLSAAEAPSGWFGLAIDVADLDMTRRLLGVALGPIKPAVQPGRRIATFRQRELGLSVAIAAMDHHGER